MKLVTFFITACTICLACSTQGPGISQTEVVPASITAQRLLPVELITLTGRPITFPPKIDRVRCIHLWATWCGPCRNELPELDTVARKFVGRIDTFLIAVSDNRQRVESLIQEKHIQSPVLLDPHGSLLQLLDTSAVPTTVCTDAAGYLLELHDPQSPYLEQTIIGGPRLWNTPRGMALFESVAATPAGSAY